MIEFLDRLPTKAGRKLITHDDGTQEYVTIESADEPENNGTPINRASMLGIQGFIDTTIEFDESGNVTETNGRGEVRMVTFNDDGSVTEVLNGQLITTKTTYFDDDGTIREVIS